MHACFKTQVAVDKDIVEANRYIDLVQVNLRRARALNLGRLPSTWGADYLLRQGCEGIHMKARGL